MQYNYNYYNNKNELHYTIVLYTHNSTAKLVQSVHQSDCCCVHDSDVAVSNEEWSPGNRKNRVDARYWPPSHTILHTRI